MTSNTALVATVIAIATAIIGVAVSAGLSMSKDLQDHILTLITVGTPAVLGVIAWLHHSHAKIVAAREANGPAARVNL